MGIFQIVGFQNGCPARGDVPLTADAKHGRLQQGSRVGCSCKNRPGYCPRHHRTGGFILGIQVHRFPQQLPQGHHRLPAARNFHSFMVGPDMGHQLPKGAAVEKPHRQPGRVGRNAQNIEILPGLHPQFRTGQALGQSAHRRHQLLPGR